MKIEDVEKMIFKELQKSHDVTSWSLYGIMRNPSIPFQNIEEAVNKEIKRMGFFRVGYNSCSERNTGYIEIYNGFYVKTYRLLEVNIKRKRRPDKTFEVTEVKINTRNNASTIDEVIEEAKLVLQEIKMDVDKELDEYNQELSMHNLTHSRLKELYDIYFTKLSNEAKGQLDNEKY